MSGRAGGCGCGENCRTLQALKEVQRGHDRSFQLCLRDGVTALAEPGEQTATAVQPPGCPSQPLERRGSVPRFRRVLGNIQARWIVPERVLRRGCSSKGHRACSRVGRSSQNGGLGGLAATSKDLQAHGNVFPASPVPSTHLPLCVPDRGPQAWAHSHGATETAERDKVTCLKEIGKATHVYGHNTSLIGDRRPGAPHLPLCVPDKWH